MSKYEKYTSEKLEELFSNFLIDSWSYSKVTSFARNEKAFEMQYIYREESGRSASSVAGNAYHEALEVFFNALKDGKTLDLVDLTQVAMDYINAVPANVWKLQKTTPSIEKCTEVTNKSAVVLIQNFFKEIEVYLSELKEIIGVELYCDEWLTINGVDIPIPCRAICDLIIKTKDDRVIVIDHKSKKAFTDDKEAAFTFGKQGITYAKSIEKKLNIHVDEVWFIENKSSKNRDGSPQLKVHKAVLDKDTTKLFEAMLYEPLKRMVEAISDADYVYMINDSDNFVDKAELNEFWAKTMVAEIETFNIPENKVELIEKRINKIRNASLGSISPKVISTFKQKASSFITYNLNNKNMSKPQKIKFILGSFGFPVKVAHDIKGFSSDTFLLKVEAGVKIASIERYKLDIANALNVENIRVSKNLILFKGESYLALEVSKKREDDLLFDPNFVDGLKLPLGKDNFGEVIRWDLNNHSTPHALVCGATGAGKSILLIATIAYGELAGVEEFVIFDPKLDYVDLASNKIKVFTEIEDIEFEMALLVEEMQTRVKAKFSKLKLVVFDEIADAIDSARKGKELDIREEVQVGYYAPKKMMPPRPKFAMQVVGKEKSLSENLKMLLQKGRSGGYRVMAATQRASVKVISGDVKVNFPVRICMTVPTEIDSKVILDEGGAELLQGYGDALISSPEYKGTVRFQGFYKHG